MLVFLLLRLAPGDPAAQMLGDQATPDQVAALRHEMGLDQPLGDPVRHLAEACADAAISASSFFFKQPVIDDPAGLRAS